MLRKKTFETLTHKRQKKKSVRRDWERNRRRRGQSSKKLWSDSYLFLKYDFRLVERNQDKNRKTCKNIFDWWRGIEKESRQLESLSLKTGFFLLLFDQSKNRFNWSNPEESQIFEKPENFPQNHLEGRFLWYGMHVNDSKGFQKIISLK